MKGFLAPTAIRIVHCPLWKVTETLFPLKVKNSERLEDDFKDSSPAGCRLQQNLLQLSKYLLPPQLH